MCAALLNASLPQELQRKDAQTLEEQVSGTTDLGPCHQGASLLDNIPQNACADTPCLHSTRCSVSIDLATHRMLQPMPGRSNVRCKPPSGGQTRPVFNSTLMSLTQLTVILSVRGNSPHHITQATSALLEIFRTASEVASAEIIVVIDDSSRSSGAVAGASPNPASATSASGSVSGASDSSAVAAAIQSLLVTIQRLITFFDAPIRVSRHSDAARPFDVAGSRPASGGYVAMVDGGVLVGRGMWAALLATMDQHPDAGLVAPLLLSNRGSGMKVSQTRVSRWVCRRVTSTTIRKRGVRALCSGNGKCAM